MLELLVDEKKEDINPYSNQISENTPLRFACKAGYLGIIEFLVKRGAFFHDEVRNICNNCFKNEDPNLLFKTLDGKEILPNFVVRLETDRLDQEIKEFIRIIKIKNFVVFKRLAKEKKDDMMGKKLAFEMKKFRDPLYLNKIRAFIL